MGDTGSRRSTLVSRLPIFRRSSSKRRDSLPSSPSSATNGVHTSSPSSTNSSSSSMGKRRNIFRTASIGFHGRKAAGEPRASTLCNGQSNSPGEEGARARGRHAFGLSVVPRGKKITRSATEDFERGKELNKSVFMNCLSSGRSSVDEGDDSGFPDDRPAKPRSRKLLPRSFSTHHKLSKTAAAAARSPPAEQPVHVMPQANELVPRSPALEECSKYLQVDNPEGSLHSPLLSSDNTTILTPSEFVPVSADSVSEVDRELLGGRPAPSLTELGPALSGSPLDPLGPAAEAAAPHLRPAEDVLLPLRETALLSDVEPRAPHAEVCPPGIDCLEEKGSCGSDGRPTQLPGAVTPSVPSVKHQLSFTQNGLEATELSTEKAYKLSITNSIPMIKPQDQCQGTSHSTVTVNRTFSPRHEEKWVERRLRSSSEGTSGRRLSHGVRDGRVEELHSLKGQRAGSSSSKMNSMDVLNRLGSCDLDEDDLMLDLEFLEDQHHQCDRDTSKHFVCREDSNQSIKSCVEILHVPTELKMKIERPKVPETPKELPFVQSSKEGELCESRPLRYNHWLSAASSDWSLLREDEPGGGLEAKSLRLMMQDCTAVKTMLLKLKRILQESVEMSPASSTHSLPVSPITEMPIPFKDLKDESSLLRLQLKEKDELISQLRDELDRNRRAHSSRADKSTQTEVLSHDPTYLNRTVSQTLSTRDRRLVPIPTEDPCKYSSPSQAAAHDGKTCQVSNVYVGRYQKTQEVGRGAQCKNGVVEASSVELAENIQSNGACSGSTQSKIKTTVNAGEVLELMNGRKDQVTLPRQQSVFVGRLGQPPRGPLSLHMYSRKNVFLQHSLYTSDLQALGQKDG